MNSTYLIALKKSSEDSTYNHFSVDEQVYYYIKQLENIIRGSNGLENLKLIYPHRFDKIKD